MSDRGERPPMPDNVLLAKMAGKAVGYDDEGGTWYVGDDPGFDPDEDEEDDEEEDES